MWNINDEGQPKFPKGSLSFLHPKESDIYLKELKEGIKSYIKMCMDTTDNEDSPIITKEWKNIVDYYERVLDILNEIYNDHVIVDISDSSYEYFWPKTR